MHEQSLHEGKENHGIERLRRLALILQNPLQNLKVCTFIRDFTLMAALSFARTQIRPSLNLPRTLHPRPSKLCRRTYLYSQV